AEDADDIAAAEAVKYEENIPAKVVYDLMDGKNSLKVWRKFRNLTQDELSKKAGITQAMITMIENGKRTGTVNVLGKLAKALNLDIDDLT
ncbi:MAG: helix-turn-helix transcriptional regulator, partial [Methylococcales bacterium]